MEKPSANGAGSVGRSLYEMNLYGMMPEGFTLEKSDPPFGRTGVSVYIEFSFSVVSLRGRVPLALLLEIFETLRPVTLAFCNHNLFSPSQGDLVYFSSNKSWIRLVNGQDDGKLQCLH